MRLASEDRRPVSEVVADPSGITRAVVLNVPVTVECVARMPALREAVFSSEPTTEVGDAMATAGVRTYVQPSKGFGDRASQSSPSRSLLRSASHPAIAPRHREQPAALGLRAARRRCGPGTRQQFGDDPNFANGTVEGSASDRRRGNIASRYASFVHT